jgi:serine phosphatase RsbU (regulator of sigma subunit)
MLRMCTHANDHLALYLIDVTGHGLDSALLSVTVTNVIRAGCITRGRHEETR